jgi:hypothetical protein
MYPFCRQRLDGTFDVDYDDGEFEMKVPEDLIRVKEAAASSGGRKKTLEEGDKVEGNYKGKGKWYAGRIQKVRLDGSYDIAYNDGEQEMRVPEDLVRAIDSADSRPKAVVISEGMKVEANYKGKGKWYPGTIKR